MAKKPAKKAKAPAKKTPKTRSRHISVNPGRVIAALAAAPLRNNPNFIYDIMRKMANEVLAEPLTLKDARTIFNNMGRVDFELLLDSMDHPHVKKLLKTLDPYSQFYKNFGSEEGHNGSGVIAARVHIVRLLASKLMKPEPKPAGRQPAKKIPKATKAPKTGPDADVILSYVTRLLNAVGSDSFEQIFSSLKSDKNLSREPLVTIASGVQGGKRPLPSSTTRKAALAIIRKGHDAFMSTRAGIEATGGRSAG